MKKPRVTQTAVLENAETGERVSVDVPGNTRAQANSEALERAARYSKSTNTEWRVIRVYGG